MNNRRNFLKTSGLLGVASLMAPAISPTLLQAKENACVLIPTETAGPFPLDLTENTTFFRRDVREDRAGVPLTVRLRIIGQDNCAPMQNVRVNIWHCDKDGLYSGYSQNNNAGQAGKTYLRGYQFTNADGIAEFLTIFPGWYSGRICHIHFQVYVSSSYAAISQLTFDLAAKNAIYAANTTLYTKGADPSTFSSDNIFSDGYSYQLASLAVNEETGGYLTNLEVTVKGNGTTGLGNYEKEMAKVMNLGQNFPNPFQGNSIIPFTLLQSAHTVLELWDLEGRKIMEVLNMHLDSGDFEIPVNLQSLGLPMASYAYQLCTTQADGTVFRHARMMTLAE
jgi:protocatechuate 3,4-dioxygenase beta subunit